MEEVKQKKKKDGVEREREGLREKKKWGGEEAVRANSECRAL